METVAELLRQGPETDHRKTYVPATKLHTVLVGELMLEYTTGVAGPET